MKARIIALSLILLFLFPLTMASIDGQDLIPEPVRTNEGAYENDFSDAIGWIAEGISGGSATSDGDQITFTMPATNIADNFYKTIPTESFYLLYYEFDVTAVDNLEGEFWIFQSGSYYTICSISGIGLYNGTIYAELSAASRISFMVVPTDPENSGNMTIDYLSIEPEGIAGFQETLDDDVLFYPDFDFDADIAESDEFMSSLEDASDWDAGGTDWDTFEDTDGILHARHDSGDANDYPLRTVKQSGLGYPTTSTYDGSSDWMWYLYFKVDYHDDADYFRFGIREFNGGGEIEWFDLTVYSKNVWHYVEHVPTVPMTDNERLEMNAQLDDGEYAEIWLAWVACIKPDENLDHVYDGSQYREGFGAVGDWTYGNSGNMPTGYGILVEGDDNCNLYGLFDDGTNEYVRYKTTPTQTFYFASGYYLEFRYRITNAEAIGRVRFYDSGLQERSTSAGENLASMTWATVKIPLTDYLDNATKSISKIRIYIDDLTDGFAGGTHGFKIDYMRIGYSDEMGWQHDMSTLEPISSSGGLIDASTTDGDKINFTNDAGSAAAEYSNIFYDPTTTNAAGSFTYYPFLEISISDVGDTGDDGSVWLLRLYDSDGAFENMIGYVDTVGIFRFNLPAITPIDLEYLRLYVHRPDDWVVVDYFKLYSIADYTISQSSVTVDDYLYVSEGVLHSNMDTGTITLDYDLTDLSFVGTYNWNKSTSYGTSELSFYRGSWSSYSNATEGDLLGGTTTDIRIRFSEDANIINIFLYNTPPQWRGYTIELIYFDMPNWHGFTFEWIVFYIPINVVSLSYYFMLGGLVLIPTSTVLLVKGGRSDMSRDKLFLFFIMFLMGWALFLGGIL